MRHKKGENINGWLIIDKPRGMGSTQVVNLTRKLFNAKKNGHAGTLDPFATGILPIAFGEATKLLPFVTDASKEYEFVIQWGRGTNTDDSEGEVVCESEKIPSREEILAALPHFVGKITQIPPAYSAIKINGERAYTLARKGVKVDVPPRNVEIYKLELLAELSNHQAKFRVACSKGTYVRTLGHDLAQYLGSCGFLQELRRTKCGLFGMESKILLEKLKNIVHSECLKEVLLPLETSLRDIAEIAVSEADADKLKKGQGVSPRAYEVESLYGRDVAAFCNDCLVAIVRIEEKRISPLRVFNL